MNRLPRIGLPRPAFWTTFAVIYGALVLSALTAIVLWAVARDAIGTRLFVSGVLGGSAGYWISELARALRRRRERRALDQVPHDVSLSMNEDGEITGTVLRGNGDLAGITIPEDLAAEFDPERPETAALLCAYVFEQTVPAALRAKMGAPTLAETRAWLERQQDDEA